MREHLPPVNTIDQPDRTFRCLPTLNDAMQKDIRVNDIVGEVTESDILF
jgi:hypothetical protein